MKYDPTLVHSFVTLCYTNTWLYNIHPIIKLNELFTMFPCSCVSAEDFTWIPKATGNRKQTVKGKSERFCGVSNPENDVWRMHAVSIVT